MTPREEARERARLLLAFADGESLQGFNGGRWVDYIHNQPPLIQYSEDWRIKPEPRRLWQWIRNGDCWQQTNIADTAAQWKASGFEVIEYQEVIK